MQEVLVNSIERGFFIINMLPILLLFAAKLNRRETYIPRLIGGIVLCLGSSIYFQHGLLKYVAGFCILTLFCWFICAISVIEAAYCVACTYAVQHISYALYQIVFQPSERIPPYAAEYIIISIIVCFISYVTVIRKLPEKGRYNLELKFSLISLCIIMTLVLGLSMLADSLKNGETNKMYYVCLAYDLLCCVFILWEQADYKEKLRKQRELDIQEQLWLKQKEIYELRKHDVETINYICHDLKHHLESLKLFSDEKERLEYCCKIEETIKSYDSKLETGSKVLNILLSQKNLLCMQNDINLTCVADGEKLNFIDAVDLYTIFGNAIDNAIESVMKVKDKEKRIISISAWTKGNLLLIKIENYFENEELEFQDEWPLTTKEEKERHGYGLKSIKHTVEKYDGCIGIKAEDNIFKVTIFIPF